MEQKAISRLAAPTSGGCLHVASFRKSPVCPAVKSARQLRIYQQRNWPTQIDSNGRPGSRQLSRFLFGAPLLQAT